MFMKERETQSEPIDLMSRLESLENDFPSLDPTQKDSEPAKIGYLVKNTFIDELADYPALRSWSLEEFLLERRTKSAPNTAPNSGVMQRLESLEEEPSVPNQFPATPEMSQRGTAFENLESLEEEQEEAPPEDESFGMIQFPSASPAFPGAAFSVHENGSFHQQQDEQFSVPMSQAMCNMNLFSDRSTLAPSDVDATFQTLAPSDIDGTFHDTMSYPIEQQDASYPTEQCDNRGGPVVVVELDSVLGKWSVGSSGHHFGRCKPCAFFWKTGCKDGQACQFCHSCPGDEKKKRSKQKQAWRRAIKATRVSLRYGLF